jgi:GntR family transcriptional regulator/MocR family aminotransferase
MDDFLGIDVASGSGLPLYRQIFDQITARIRAGTFPEGFRLPPTRTLASALGTHRNTVVRAYAELEAAGFLTSTVGRGTFVRGAPRTSPESGRAEVARAALPWQSLISASAAGEPLKRWRRMQRLAPPSDAVDLTKMSPPPELLPHELFRRCVDHVLRTTPDRALAYAPTEGHRRLRDLTVADLARRHVPARAEDVVICAGSQQALDLITRTLVNPGDLVLTHCSTYAGALQVFAASCAKVAGVPSDDEGPELGALRRLGQQRPKLLYLMPNHVNPTGACISARRREAVLEWARDAQVAIVEDDYAADLELEDEPPPPAMRALDPDVIHVGSFSKRLIPGLRIGYVVVPSELGPHLLSLKRTTDLGSSALHQLALAEFLDRGYLAGHLNRAQPEYRRRRDVLLAALREHLPAGYHLERPVRGLSVWVALPTGLDPDAVFEEALRRRVVVGSSRLYAADDRVIGGVRLNYCFEPHERLRVGAERVGQALAALASGNGGSVPHAPVELV